MSTVAAITIRPATRSDLEFVSADHQTERHRVIQLIDNGQVYLALTNGEPSGYARVEYLWSKIPYLALVWVLEQHRRRGVGRSLLATIEHDARKAGHEFLYSSVTANEPPPREWHLHMGFTECGYIAGINPDGVDEIFFHKPI